MSDLIYVPQGRAREYAALALNIYAGCKHGCLYCFAPGATHKTKEEFGNPRPRSATFLLDLQKELEKRDAKGSEHGRVLLCFTTDPYQELDAETKLTRQTIQLLHRYGYGVTVLTKGGTRALRDIDLFGPGDAFASTLTFIDDDESRKWEPNAALPNDRLVALQTFQAAGVMTWASMEPVIDTVATIHLIMASRFFVDAFKVGTWNHDNRANEIDWRRFAHNVTALLDRLGYKRQPEADALGKGEYYVKKDLAKWL